MKDHMPECEPIKRSDYTGRKVCCNTHYVDGEQAFHCYECNVLATYTSSIHKNTIRDARTHRLSTGQTCKHKSINCELCGEDTTTFLAKEYSKVITWDDNTASKYLICSRCDIDINTKPVVSKGWRYVPMYAYAGIAFIACAPIAVVNFFGYPVDATTVIPAIAGAGYTIYNWKEKKS